MDWQDFALLDTVWQPVRSFSQPTNPSSLALAVVGVVTLLGYQIFARPGHREQNRIDSTGTIAQPPVSGNVAENMPDERRRVA